MSGDGAPCDNFHFGRTEFCAEKCGNQGDLSDSEYQRDLLSNPELGATYSFVSDDSTGAVPMECPTCSGCNVQTSRVLQRSLYLFVAKWHRASGNWRFALSTNDGTGSGLGYFESIDLTLTPAAGSGHERVYRAPFSFSIAAASLTSAADVASACGGNVPTAQLVDADTGAMTPASNTGTDWYAQGSLNTSNSVALLRLETYLNPGGCGGPIEIRYFLQAGSDHSEGTADGKKTISGCKSSFNYTLIVTLLPRLEVPDIHNAYLKLNEVFSTGATLSWSQHNEDPLAVVSCRAAIPDVLEHDGFTWSAWFEVARTSPGAYVRRVRGSLSFSFDIFIYLRLNSSAPPLPHY